MTMMDADITTLLTVKEKGEKADFYKEDVALGELMLARMERMGWLGLA